MSLAQARHILAASRGTPTGAPSRCAICGSSPFAAAGSLDDLLGNNFTSFGAMQDPACDAMCLGCRSLLAGKPGDVPQPLRTTNCLAVEGDAATYPRTDEIAAILREPPAGRFVLVWAESKKKHASLFAGVSTRERIVVGADDATIEYVPLRDAARLDAVSSLLSGFSRVAVLTGDYTAPMIGRFGAAAWARLEAVVAPIRATSLLDLLAAVAPEGEAPPQEAPVLDERDHAAANLLAAIAQASAYRGAHGKEFWGGFFRHRVERFRRLPLASFVARLIDVCQTSSTAESTQAALAMVSGLSAEETAGIEQSIRERPALVVALSYGRIVRTPH